MKVLFQSRTTLYTAPGGDTTQLLKTKEYLEKLGVEVIISLDLIPDLRGVDIVHVFNLMRPQDVYLQIENAKKAGKKVALSTIYGPYVEFEKKARGGLLQFMNKFLTITQIEYLKVIARLVLNGEHNKGTWVYLLYGHKRLQRKIIKMVDVFLPNSHSEMKRVATDFNMDVSQFNYVSIPNAVDVSKFNYDKTEIDSENERYRDCVLCVSRIEGRKNQLNVIRAVKGLPYQFVFIGKAGTNSTKYSDLCRIEGGDNCTFLGQIDHAKLPQFYKLCKVHVLASWMETPGLSSLEAGIMYSNVVVTKKGDTEDYFKEYAYYCEPDDLLSIRKAIVDAYSNSFDMKFYDRIIENYKWEDTAAETLKGYNSIK